MGINLEDDIKKKFAKMAMDKKLADQILKDWESMGTLEHMAKKPRYRKIVINDESGEFSDEYEIEVEDAGILESKDPVTKLLVNLVKAIEDSPEFTAYLLKAPKEFIAWYEALKQQQRAVAEAIAAAKKKRRLVKSGLDKLSKEEKRALGLADEDDDEDDDADDIDIGY